MTTVMEHFIFDLAKALNIENVRSVYGGEHELIELIRNCPFLYDKSRPDFKDTQKKECTWQAISVVLNSPVHDCMSRWKSLREQYAKMLKALTNNYNNNDHDVPKLDRWEYANEMKFLDAHIKQRRYKANFQSEFVDADSQHSEATTEDYKIEWLEDVKQSVKYSKERKLINLVKTYPVLYNKNHVDSKSTLAKDKAWLSISKILAIPTLECKLRWRTMRERYSRERKHQKEDPDRKIWDLYEDLAFIDSHIKTRRHSLRPILPKPEYTVFIKSPDVVDQVTNSELIVADDNTLIQNLDYDNGSGGDVDDDNDELNYPQHHESGDISPKIETKTEIGHRDIAAVTVTSSQDEDDLFGQSIAAELRRIPNRKKKMKVKANIYKLLWEAESD